MTQPLKLLTKLGIQHFKTNINQYTLPYVKGEDAYFEQELKQAGILVDSNITADLQPLCQENESNGYFKDVKVIYESLQHLTPAQASQERLWVSLSLTEPYRKYMFKELAKSRSPENKVISKFYFNNSPRRSLFLHMLARLWWVGYLTFDDDKDIRDPYLLTKFFCKTDFAARCVIFFSSNFTANRKITRGILKGLILVELELKNQKIADIEIKMENFLDSDMLTYIEEEEPVVSSIEIKRSHLVHILQQLNILGGIKMLDLYSEKEVMDLTVNWLRKYILAEV